MSLLSPRPATPDDASAIAQLWLEATTEVAARDPLYTPAITLANLTKHLETDLDSGTKQAYVIYAADTLAAYASFRIDAEAAVFTARRYLYVIDLDVAAPFRQQGLSRVLMAELEAYAKTKAIHRLELAVVFNDPRAKAVWARHGFTPHLLVLHKDI